MKRNVISRLVTGIATTAVLAIGGIAPVHADSPTGRHGATEDCPMGHGMMGGGMGMMGGGMGMGPLYMLDLSDEQRTKINKISDEVRMKHWATMGKIMEEQSKLRDLLQVDTPDPKKVGAAYGAIAQHQRQMVEAHVQARNQAEQVLSKEQREQLRNLHRGMGGRGPGMGPGMMGPGYGPRGMGPGMMTP